MKDRGKMTKIVRISLFIVWVFSAPFIILGIGFAGLEVFHPGHFFDDLISLDYVGLLPRILALFATIFPIYLLFYLIRREEARKPPR